MLHKPDEHPVDDHSPEAMRSAMRRATSREAVRDASEGVGVNRPPLGRDFDAEDDAAERDIAAYEWHRDHG